MTTMESDENESIGSELDVEQPGPARVNGENRIESENSVFLSNQFGFSDPTIAVEGHYTDPEKTEYGNAHQEVRFRITAGGDVEESAVTLGLEPEEAREVARSLLEAASIVNGDVSAEDLEE